MSEMQTVEQQEQIAALQAKLDAAQGKIAELSGGLVAGDKEGFAECLTEECEAYKELVPIPIRIEVVEKYFPPGSAVHGIESTTKYVLAGNDRDMICPHCNGPRSVLEDRPRKIPKGI